MSANEAAGGEQARVLERVLAPLVNNNEPEAQVVEIHGVAGASVKAGDPVCTLETSKSTVDVEVETAGVLGPFAIALDDRITAGDLIVEVLDRPASAAQVSAAARPAGAEPKLTKKAQARAGELGVDLTGLPTDRILTERDIERLAPEGGEAIELPADIAGAITPRSVVIVGGGGLGRSIIDVIRRAGQLEVLGVIDDGLAAGHETLGIRVLGDRRLLAPLALAGLGYAVNAVGGIGRMKSRTDVFETIAGAGLATRTIVDPGAHLAESAVLADGVHVMPGAVVWSSATIGPDTLVNTNVTVSHDCIIGARSHLAPGAILAGETTVGAGTLIGMGVATAVGVAIGASVIVGNNAVVTDTVPDGTIVPAGSVWPSS